MQQAILYTRFSSLEQRDGVSLERQLERCNELALEMGLNVERIVSDSGKSAFKAEHRLSGAGMAQIEQDAKNGILIGKVLLIEKISRLSREDPHDSYDLVRSLTKNGVTVACWDKRMVLKAYGNLELVGLIQYFVMAQTVYEESVAKQDFSRDKWARRRVEMQSGKIVTSLCPAWLKPSPDRSHWEVIGEGADRDGVMRHDRGAIVKFILAQADQGLGSYQIASRLNELRVPPWPRFQGENRNPPKDWSHKRVHRIMTDIAVIGDCQPMQRDDKGNSVPACDPIRNYYPRLVAPDMFQRVQETAGARREVKGRRSAVVANLVSGLAVCEYCGGKMIYHRGRTTGSVPTRHGVADAMVKVDTGSLVCGNASRKIAEDHADFCDNKRWVAYLGLERALLDSCLHLAMDDSAFAQTNVIAELNVKIADLRRDVEIAIGKAEKLINTFATSDGAAADRLFRSALDALQTVEWAQKRKVRIVIIDGLGDITRNGISKAFLTISAAFAELERDTIRERISTVKADQKDRGRYLGGKPPFGFRVDHDGSLIPIEAEQQVIRKIIATRRTKKSIRFIREMLMVEDDRSLSLGAIHRIIHDYAGQIVQPPSED